MTTQIPGVKAGHQIITPTCRSNRGQQGAWDEAVARLAATYSDYAAAEANADASWHLVLVRDGDE